MFEKNTFASAALVTGVLSLLTSSSILGGIVFGSLAIIFAFISKADNLKMPPKGRLAVNVGIIGIVTTIALLGNSIYSYHHDPAYKKNVDSAFIQMYGMSCEQFFKEIGNTFTGK